jgi:thiamine biosynthesis protein ThiC
VDLQRELVGLIGAHEKDVQVMIEGHGHVPLNEVDVAAAYDHILNIFLDNGAII